MKKNLFFASIITAVVCFNLSAEKVNIKETFLDACADKDVKLETISTLLAQNPKLLNKKDKDEKTCLRIVTENGREDIVDLLISNEKIDLESADKAKGYTPLSIAVVLNKEPRKENNPFQNIAKKLINKGADINACTDERANSVLMLAVYRANVEIVKILLSKKDLEIDSLDENERTALHIARTLLRQAEAAKANGATETEELIADYKLIVELLEQRVKNGISFSESMHYMEGLGIFLGFFIQSDSDSN